MEPPKPQVVVTPSKPAEFAPPTRNGIQNGFSEFTSSSKVRLRNYLCIIYSTHTSFGQDTLVTLKHSFRAQILVFTVYADLANLRVARIGPFQCPLIWEVLAKVFL